MSFFSIDFQWLAREYGDSVARSTLAEITITANEWKATEIEDLLARTVRPAVRVSAFALAQWFASNWWRLLWEPERNTASWKMSHKVGAAGEGYLWPDLTFISDGEAVLVRGRPSPLASKQPVRYLNSFDVFIPAEVFESGMHSFIEAVTRRLSDTKTQAAEFESLWKEVLVERRDPKLASWRKLEAIMGYDPDEAPDQTIEALQIAALEYGSSAVEEMAAESMQNAIAHIETLWGEPRKEALPLVIPDFDSLKRRISDAMRSSLSPWQKATEAARIVREVCALSPGPVSTSTLADVLQIRKGSLENPIGVKGPMDAGFRNGNLNGFSVFLKSPFQANRRFALLRLVGDHLTAPQNDKLLPAAPGAKTQRQKFQRAFAQEFLCPYSDLVSYLQSDEPSDEDIEDAAHHFEVSALMVKTILVNKGDLERSCLPCPSSLVF
ncbi:MAG: ImmA/IrrE family metallo-endopeptidase [Syntrophobacteraceae bacterium]